MSTPKVLHIYCRVSTDVQLQGFSLQAQGLAGIEKAKQLGFDYRLHVDGGKSAKDEDIGNRPALTELLALVDTGEVSDIFVTETDRLTRSPELHFKLKVKFTRHNVIIHTNSGSTNFKDFDQEFMSDLRALMAKRENSLKSARSVRGMAEAAKRGKCGGGVMLPYGYTKDSNGILVVNEEESEIYKQMVRWCLSGDGTPAIAKKLNALNIPTRGKKALPNGFSVSNKYTKTKRHVTNAEFQWRPGVVYMMLSNSLYIGKRKYKGETVSAPPIIDEQTWGQVQSQLNRNRSVSRNHKTAHFFLLKGLIRCGHQRADGTVCGCNFYGSLKWNGRIYMCSSKRLNSCGIRSINFDRLNELVWNRVVNSGEYMQQIRTEWSQSGNETIIKTTDKDIDTIKSEMRVLETRAKKVIELYELDRLTLLEYDERQQKIKREQETLKEQLRLLEQKRLALDDTKGEVDKLLTGIMGLWKIRERLNELKDEEKRTLLSRLGVNVIINWDAIQRCHHVEITFAVNGYSYEKKEVIRRKSSQSADEPRHYFDANLLLKSIIRTDSELGLQITPRPLQLCADAGYSSSIQNPQT